MELVMEIYFAARTTDGRFLYDHRYERRGHIAELTQSEGITNGLGIAFIEAVTGGVRVIIAEQESKEVD